MSCTGCGMRMCSNTGVSRIPQSNRGLFLPSLWEWMQSIQTQPAMVEHRKLEFNPVTMTSHGTDPYAVTVTTSSVSVTAGNSSCVSGTKTLGVSQNSCYHSSSTVWYPFNITPVKERRDIAHNSETCLEYIHQNHYVNIRTAGRVYVTPNLNDYTYFYLCAKIIICML